MESNLKDAAEFVFLVKIDFARFSKEELPPLLWIAYPKKKMKTRFKANDTKRILFSQCGDLLVNNILCPFTVLVMTKRKNGLPSCSIIKTQECKYSSASSVTAKSLLWCFRKSCGGLLNRDHLLDHNWIIELEIYWNKSSFWIISPRQRKTENDAKWQHIANITNLLWTILGEKLFLQR